MAIYSSCKPLALNCTVYSNPERTSLAAAGYYTLDSITFFYVNGSGVITSFNNNCSRAYSLTYSASDCSSACYYGSSTTLYTLTTSLAVNDYVFSNNIRTNFASAGYYSDGTSCYTVVTVSGTSYISSIANCPSNCTPYGYYAYSSCEYIPQYGCVGDVDYYHDGSCGYYTQPRGYCGCY